MTHLGAQVITNGQGFGTGYLAPADRSPAGVIGARRGTIQGCRLVIANMPIHLDEAFHVRGMPSQRHGQGRPKLGSRGRRDVSRQGLMCHGKRASSRSYLLSNGRGGTVAPSQGRSVPVWWVRQPYPRQTGSPGWPLGIYNRDTAREGRGAHWPASATPKDESLQGQRARDRTRISDARSFRSLAPSSAGPM